jgi:hypothetical protein
LIGSAACLRARPRRMGLLTSSTLTAAMTMPRTPTTRPPRIPPLSRSKPLGVAFAASTSGSRSVRLSTLGQAAFDQGGHPLPGRYEARRMRSANRNWSLCAAHTANAYGSVGIHTRRSGCSSSGISVALRNDRWPRASREIRLSGCRSALPDGFGVQNRSIWLSRSAGVSAGPVAPVSECYLSCVYAPGAMLFAVLG